MFPIVTARLSIRPLQQSDFDAMHKMYSDPNVVRYIPGGVRDEDGTWHRLSELIAHHEQHGVSKWAVALTDSGQVIGDCGLQYLLGTHDLELGFHFARTHWGHGYATEAASACLNWALLERSESIFAIVDPAHAASRRILQNIGMRQLGPDYLLDRVWIVYEATRCGNGREET